MLISQQAGCDLPPSSTHLALSTAESCKRLPQLLARYAGFEAGELREQSHEGVELQNRCEMIRCLLPFPPLPTSCSRAEATVSDILIGLMLGLLFVTLFLVSTEGPARLATAKGAILPPPPPPPRSKLDPTAWQSSLSSSMWAALCRQMGAGQGLQLCPLCLCEGPRFRCTVHEPRQHQGFVELKLGAQPHPPGGEHI